MVEIIEGLHNILPLINTALLVVLVRNSNYMAGEHKKNIKNRHKNHD